MYEGPKYNKNFLYPYTLDQSSSGSNPPTNNTLRASSPTVNDPAPQCNQKFPRPSMNRQRSGAYSSSSTSSTYASASAFTGNSAAEYVLQATTYSSPIQQTSHRASRPSLRRSQNSCSSDTCSQIFLLPSLKPFDALRTQQWLSQLRCDIPMRSSIRDVDSDSGGSNLSISGSGFPAPTSVSSSSRIRRRRGADGLYELEYDRPKIRAREARKKEIAERQTADRQTFDREKGKRKTPEYWNEWQAKEENGGWV